MARDSQPVVRSSSTRRRWLKGIGGTAGGAVFAGCTGGEEGNGDGNGGDAGDDSNGGTTGGGRTVTVLTPESDPNTQAVYDAAAEDFESQTGNTVEFEYVSFEDLTERLSSMIRGGNPPEIGSFTMVNAGNLYEEGLLAPVGEVLDGLGDIPENSIMSVDGESYTVPHTVRIQSQTVRRDLVEEAGHGFPDSALDIDWETHEQWVSDVDDLGDARGIGVTSAQTNKGTHEGVQYLWSNGVDIWGGPTGNVEVRLDQGENREKAIETLEHVKTLHNHSPPASDWGWADVQQAFGTGQIGNAQYSIGRILAAVEDNNPQWSEDTVPMETPYNQHKESGAGTVAFISSFTLFNDGENLGVARDFLEFFYESDHYIDFLHTVPFHNSPPIPEVFQSDAYRDHEAISSRPDILEFQEELLPRTTSFLLTADDGGLNPAAGAAYNNGTLGSLLARVNVNDMDPGEAIDTTAEELRRQLG